MTNSFKSRVSKRSSKKTQSFSYRPLAFAIAVAISDTLPNITKAATYTVTTTADTGAGSLREALSDANTITPNETDTILFDITPLNRIRIFSELMITDSVVIRGPASEKPNKLIIDATNNHRILVSSTVGQTVTLEIMTLSNGFSTSSGGAIFIDDSNLVMNNTRVEGSSTSGLYARGGGIYVKDGSLILNQTTVTDNSTSGNYADGAGIWGGNSTLNLFESTISNNSLSGINADGGGVYIQGGNLFLCQTTISGNTSTGSNGSGAGIYIVSTPTNIFLSTITDNSSSSGAGGISASFTIANDNVSIFNSILSANTGTEGNFNNRTTSQNSVLNIENSLFGDNASEITGYSYDNIINNNPEIGPLLDNAGPTLSHLPNPNSPAIDKGNNSALAFSLSNDQRGTGFTRILNNIVDIGAIERQTTSPNAVINTNDNGPGSLRQAVLYANGSTGLDILDLSGLTHFTSDQWRYVYPSNCI